jgi:hypothetical protein
MSMTAVRAWSATTRSRTSRAWVGAVAGAGQRAGAVEDRAAGVDLVEVVDALQHGGDTLQAHAGVDVLRRAGRPAMSKSTLLRTCAELVLHEDEVPDSR